MINYYELGQEIGFALFAEPTFESINFGAKGKRKCVKGYSCGYSCISTKRKCRVALKGEAKNFAQYVKQNKSRLTKAQKSKAKGQNIGLKAELKLKRTKRELPLNKSKNITVKDPADFEPDISKIPTDRVRSAYRHMHTTNMVAVEQDMYKKYIIAIKNEALKHLPVDQRQNLTKELEKVSSEYVQKRENVWASASQTQSAFITGRHNMNTQQAASRGSSYEKTIANFDDWMKKRKNQIFDTVGVTHIKEQKRKRDDLIRRLGWQESDYAQALNSSRDNKQKRKNREMRKELNQAITEINTALNKSSSLVDVDKHNK